jgi:hypothetical protein
MNPLKLNPYKDLEEINIKDEVVDFVYGADFGKEKFIPYILRNFRSDELGNPVRCNCWNESSNEGRVGCGDCDGEGILWDEKIVPGFLYYITTKSLQSVGDYKGNLGRSEEVAMGFISPHNVDMTRNDKVFAPVLNAEGAFTIPYRVREKYYVTFDREFRLAHGKKEYTHCVIKRIS